MPREGSSPAVGTLSPLLLHKRGQAEGSRRLIPIPPRLLFAVAGGRGMLTVPEGLRLPLWCWGGCPEPRCAPGEGLGWKGGGGLKPLPAPGGAPGHRWDQAVEPGAFGRPLPSLGGGKGRGRGCRRSGKLPRGMPPWYPPRVRTGEGKQQSGAKPPQNIPAAVRRGGSRPAGRGPRI